MNCACVYVDYDGDTEDFSHTEVRCAAKEHVCCECGRTITKGETYEVCKEKWDRRFATYKTCLDCLSIRDSFFCSGWIFGEMLSLLTEHLESVCYGGGSVSADCMVTLTKVARDRVCDMIEEIWDKQERRAALLGPLDEDLR